MYERRDRLDNLKSERAKRIRALSRRSSRFERDQLWVEGPQAVLELLACETIETCDLFVLPSSSGALALQEALTSHDYGDIRIFIHEVSPALAQDLMPAAQGLAALVKRSQVLDLKLFFPDDPILDHTKPSQCLLLPAVQDPGNVGTLVRLADAMGLRLVILGSNSAQIDSPKVMRASVGSVFHLPLRETPDPVSTLLSLREHGWKVWAADLKGTQALGSPELSEEMKSESIVWLMGNEAHGLSQELLDHCDRLVSIPMYGKAESLNVATAASLCLFTGAQAQNS